MMLGEWIRRTGFFTLDIIRGGNVLKHYRDISKKMSGEIDSLNELPNILNYAKEKVPYYSTIKGNELGDFPVINKSIIMKNYNLFLSKEFMDTKTYIGYQLVDQLVCLLRHVKILEKEIEQLLI